jgi:bacteriocin biosynthesis cyclodehydratase domain-containing protein
LVRRRLLTVTSSVPEQPLLAPWYRLVGDGDRLLFEHSQVVVALEGGAVKTLLPSLLPLLDGTRTVGELVERLGVAARPAIERALETLAAHELLTEGLPAPPEVRVTAHALAAAHRIAPSVATERLASGSVGVVGSGAAAVDVARLLRLAGLQKVRRVSWRRGAEVELVVVAPAPDELDMLPGWNRLALSRELRWLAVRPFDGRMTAIGPLVLPGESCCYECVLLRRAANVDYGDDLADIEVTPEAATADPAFDALSHGIAVHVALRWVVGRDSTLPGVMFTVEARPRPSIGEHPVLRVPRCPACSSAERLAAPLPWHEARAA